MGLARVVRDPGLPIGLKIKERWQVVSKIGQGGCGAVYEMQALKDSSELVALKVEPIKQRKPGVLKMEVNVLKALQGRPHITRLYACGQQPKFCYIVITRLGPNLSELRANLASKKFSVSTTVRTGLQCLRAIQDLHDVGYVHRDIKPGNFAVGYKNEDQRHIYLLDFGLARKYAEIDDQGHKTQLREPRARAFFRGTVRYCSANVHLRLEQGRHDDLMSLLYMLIELMHGLPWIGARGREAVADMKQNITDDKLLNKCPPEFTPILAHIKQLNYRSEPNYQLIHDKLTAVMTRLNIQESHAYDWEDLEKTQKTPELDEEPDEKLIDDKGSRQIHSKDTCSK